MSYLGKALAGILLFVALLALPAALKLQRSVPCTGLVTAVSESQSQEHESDGQSSVVFSSNHWLSYTNPSTGAPGTAVLTDLPQGKGEQVALLYDPTDKSVFVDKPLRLFSTPLTILSVALVFWLIVLIALRS